MILLNLSQKILIIKKNVLTLHREIKTQCDMKIKKTVIGSLTDTLALLLYEMYEIEEQSKRKQFFNEVIKPFMKYYWNIINIIKNS